jgi:hypothetical protein
MNKLYVGLSKSISIPKGGCLFIDDEVPEIPRARVFAPRFDSFNPLHKIDYKKAREMADVLYTLYPQGEGTLTVRNGRRELLAALLKAKRLDNVKGGEEVSALIDDILTSPVLRDVLCRSTNFSFNPRSTILARLNRAELGEFDALVLGLLLMSHFRGQVIVPDFGFYGREAHVSLIREERLIAGVNNLRELSPRLRQSVLLIEDKEPSRAGYEDAETLALYAGLRPDPLRAQNPYNDFIQAAMGSD